MRPCPPVHHRTMDLIALSSMGPDGSTTRPLEVMVITTAELDQLIEAHFLGAEGGAFGRIGLVVSDDTESVVRIVQQAYRVDDVWRLDMTGHDDQGGMP